MFKDTKNGSTRNFKICVVQKLLQSSWRFWDAVNNILHKYINICYNSLQYPFLPNYAFIDSAASDFYAQYEVLLQNIQLILNTIPIYLTNGNSLLASHTRVLPNIP